jgi:hypothetical protein
VIAACVNAPPMSEYYSAETLASAEAKRSWVPPDRRRIDF